MTGDLMDAAAVLQIGQRVEFYLEDDDIRYMSRIEDITSDYLVVAMPTDEKRRPVIPAVGEQIYGLAIGETCRYRFFSVFRGKKRDPIPVWLLKKPDIVERHQKRGFVRVNVRLPIQVRIIDTEGREGDLMRIHTVDVSGGGISFDISHRVKINSRAAIVFPNFPGIGVLSLMARIVRCQPLGSHDNGWQIGADFLELNRGTMNKIIHFVFSELRRQLTWDPDSLWHSEKQDF